MKTFTVYNQTSALDLQSGQKAYPIRFGHIHEDETWLEVHALPGRKNMSHEACTSGWLGTTNDISATALGEFEIVSVQSKYLKDGREQIKIAVR